MAPRGKTYKRKKGRKYRARRRGKPRKRGARHSAICLVNKPGKCIGKHSTQPYAIASNQKAFLMAAIMHDLREDFPAFAKKYASQIASLFRRSSNDQGLNLAMKAFGSIEATYAAMDALKRDLNLTSWTFRTDPSNVVGRYKKVRKKEVARALKRLRDLRRDYPGLLPGDWPKWGNYSDAQRKGIAFYNATTGMNLDKQRRGPTASAADVAAVMAYLHENKNYNNTPGSFLNDFAKGITHGPGKSRIGHFMNSYLFAVAHRKGVKVAGGKGGTIHKNSNAAFVFAGEGGNYYAAALNAGTGKARRFSVRRILSAIARQGTQFDENFASAAFTLPTAKAATPSQVVVPATPLRRRGDPPPSQTVAPARPLPQRDDPPPSSTARPAPAKPIRTGPAPGQPPAIADPAAPTPDNKGKTGMLWMKKPGALPRGLAGNRYAGLAAGLFGRGDKALEAPASAQDRPAAANGKDGPATPAADKPAAKLAENAPPTAGKHKKPGEPRLNA